jgi:LmbE family N-acetylglucosaminyl deacetylase
VKHVFVSPHPDDVALSCGGLIAGLRDRGDQVTILTVFSGPGDLPRLTPYQKAALGFGGQEKGEPADAHSAPDVGPDAPSPQDVMAVRRAEDAAYARFVGASIVFVNRPDGVFRNYLGDGQLMGRPRQDDPPPTRELRRALTELGPDRLYLPFAIGGHVDHRQAHRAALEVLAEPESQFLSIASFYEDFPYALWHDFQRLDQLDSETIARLPEGVRLQPRYVEIGDVLDRKLEGLLAYESQLGRLFGGESPMADAVRRRAAQVGAAGGVGPAERYWRITLD